MKTGKGTRTATNSKPTQRSYTPTPQERIDLYKQMLFIRRFEEHTVPTCAGGIDPTVGGEVYE